jgi:signal peptidase I
MGAAAVAVVALQLQLSPVLSASMTGAFDAGSLLVSRPVAPDQVRPGDVIVFTPPGTADRYAHRVVTTERGDAGVAVTTRGDANPEPDPWRAQLGQQPVPRVVLAVPAAGRLLVATADGGARALLLAVAGLAVAVTGTRALLGPPVGVPAASS